MKLSISLQCLLIAVFSYCVLAVHPTDSLMDGDPAQSNYLPNHNMDPDVIMGGSFGQIWQFNSPPSANGQVEQFDARCLVYTPSSTGVQIVLAFSEQNRLYALDAANGTLYVSRDLGAEGEVPFLVSDLGDTCSDITGTIGITGTPVVDPATDTVYFWAKSYILPQYAGQGYQYGAYRFHAVDAATLKEKPGFPVSIQGQPADNDNTRWFTGGNHLQRAGLNLINGVIYTGFGAHCDLFNYTGWVFGMETSGKFVTAYATMGGPGAQPQDGTWNGGGGGAGVWMGGSAIATDGQGRIFVTTGNGFRQRDNGQSPASGRVHLDTLSEAIVNFGIDSTTGALTQQDYFEPYSYLAMDSGDRDLGSAGIVLLDDTVFRGTGVARMAIACGKNSVCYVVNRDNLGGYKLGVGGGDAIIQSFTPPNGYAVFTNGGSYPLEGGWYYITPLGSPTYVYRLGFSDTGVPGFTLAAQTIDTSGWAVGVGPPTITTVNGRPGSAVLWVMDKNAGLRAYYAVPSNGQMTKIPLPASPALSKFQRPVFGNGRYYISSIAGSVVGYGSPVAVPLTCSPVDFGSVLIGSLATSTVTCTTNIALKSIKGLIIGNSIFQALNSSLPSDQVASGASFSFPVTFNLSGYTLPADGGNLTISPGVQTSAINIYTNNSVTGWASNVPVSLSAKVVSAAPVVAISPLEVDFPGIVIGSDTTSEGSDDTFVISNLGQSNMKILGYAYTPGAISKGALATTTYTNVTYTNGVATLDVDGYFTSTDLPPVGTVIAGGGSITVDALFQTSVIWHYFTSLVVYTSGGAQYTILTGAASSLPVALFQQSTIEGGWITIPNCPVPANGCTTNIDMGVSKGLSITNIVIQLTNLGGSALTVTKSKPPISGVLFADNPYTDFSEGLMIPPGASSSATVSFEPGPPILNSNGVFTAQWTLNTNDLTFGVHVLNFTGTVITNKTGPLLPGGNSLYQYLGCYQDNVNLRLEAKSTVNTGINTNGLCQNQTYNAGLIFAGTEYYSECWSGNVIPPPSALASDSQCNYACVGDSSQSCGGYGGFMSLFYDSSRYFPTTGVIIGATGKGPTIVPTVGSYKYLGCYTDSTASSTLQGKSGTSTNQTLENCATFCSGYTYFGAEYSSECYCSNTISTASTLGADSACTMLCSGNQVEFCGAGGQLSVYVNNNTAASSSTSTHSTSTLSTSSITTISTSASPSSSAISAYTYLGCQTDNVNARTLSAKSQVNNGMTVEMCASFCSAYTYFGVEYGQECYCGNSLLASSTPATDGRCNYNCAGTTTETCGGSNGLSLYELTSVYSVSTTSTTSATATSSQSSSLVSISISSTTSSSTTTTTSSTISMPTGISAYSYVSCWTDNVANRTLQALSEVDYSLTVEKCALFCYGYTYFGAEYGRECYCDNSLLTGTTAATDGRCSYGCAGNSTEICGGQNGLSLYKLNAPSPPVTTSSTSSSSYPSLTSSSSTSASSSSASTISSLLSTSSSSTLTSSSSSSTQSSSSSTFSSSTSSSSTSSSSSTILSVSTPIPTPWNYVGCANDTNGARALNGLSTTSSTLMTIEYCQNFCLSHNYSYAGVEYSTECWCGVGIFQYAQIGKTGCTNTCSGNSTEICGGSSRISIYNYTLPYNGAQLIPSIGAYSLKGCFVDNVNARGIVGYQVTTTSMTNELCVSTCHGKGYGIAGIENGNQCFCGNTVTTAATNITDCQAFFCPGNAKEFCSAGSRLLVYST